MAGGENSPTQPPPPAKRQKESISTTTTTAATTTIHSLGEDQAPAAMTDGRKRRRQHRRGKGHRAPPIHKLGEDLLLEIFLRLPSLATLVRAALTCRAWRRAVASSPSFRRRFRALHPPPLLGLFFEAPGPVQTPNTPAFPAFVPARRRDKDLTAAVRGGDFFLTSLEDIPDEGPCWDIVDYCRGCVLLMNWDDASLVVFNPLTRSEDVFDLGSQDMFNDSRGHYVQVNPRLLFSDEDPASFRVVLLAHDECRVRATVFSSDTWEWSVLPWVDVPRLDDDKCWIQVEGGMQANGFLYWVYEDQDRRYLVSLDTATMEFSVTQLPRCLRYSSFDVGETKDGVTCIAYSDQLNVGVLMHTRDDGVEKWVLDKVVSLDRELERALHVGLDEGSVLNHLVDKPSDLSVLALREGYVYLSTSTMYHDPQTPCWFLSLCLETMRLERLFRRTFDSAVHPYIMAWPPSLVGNYGSFALEDASSH